MNNPFKVIGISVLISVLVIFSLFELPKMLIEFDQSQWLVGIALLLLLTLNILLSMLKNAQKMQQNIRVRSNS